jgi:predicted PurR-regulated permease PerM
MRPTARSEALALWTLAVIAIVFFLRAASQLLIPIALGVILSYALEPVVAWLERHRVPRLAGASLVMLVLLGLCGWGVYSLKDNAAAALEALPEAARRAREMVASSASTGPAASIQEAAGVLQGKPADSSAPKQNDKAAAGKAGAGAGQGSAAAPSGAMPAVQRAVGSIFALAGHLTVIVFLIFFLLLSGHHVRDRIVEVSGPDEEGQRLAARIIDDVNAQIQRFLLVRLVTSAVVAIATWGVLALMGVANAAVWGILAGVFNSIPYFGPVIVSGGLLVVGLVQGGGPSDALKMAGAALVITSLEGWLLTPPLMGKAERMSLLAVFLGLLLWTWIWGAWGTILAVPMLVVLKSLGDHVESLKPVGRLMAP